MSSRRVPQKHFIIFILACLTTIIFFQNCVHQESNTASSVAPIRPDFALMDVHVLEDLHGVGSSSGCDIWTPTSLACRWAVTQYCRAQGYVGGTGPMEWQKSSATVVCAAAQAATYFEFVRQGECAGHSPTSLYCESFSRRSCIERGYTTSLGVIAANMETNSIVTLCLHGSSVFDPVQFQTTDLLGADSAGACSIDGIVSGIGCQHNVHRYCRAKGYIAGFQVLEFDATTGIGSASCVNGIWVDTGIAQSAGIDGIERPARVGEMILGGPSYANDLIYADVIVNKTNQPLLIRSMSPASTYVADETMNYSKDMCFYLGRVSTLQFDDNDDGEVACTYSEENASPSIQFGSRLGLLLRPGERLAFQGTPQWGSGGYGLDGDGLYAYANVTISSLNPGDIGLRRLRFPKWDSAYPVAAGNVPLFVPAGCFTNLCATQPVQVPIGKELRNSNDWVAVTKATRIRGVSFFLGSSQIPGRQRFQGCLRVVQQGGLNIRSPWCFDVRNDRFGPSVFNLAFGAQQNGSSFVPLDIDVPAGALIGVDFTLSSETAGAMDLATYVWAEAN